MRKRKPLPDWAQALLIGLAANLWYRAAVGHWSYYWTVAAVVIAMFVYDRSKRRPRK